MLVSYVVDPVTLQAECLEWASDHIRDKTAQALEVLTWSEVQRILALAKVQKSLGKSPAAWLLEPWVYKAMTETDHSSRIKATNNAAKAGKLCATFINDALLHCICSGNIYNAI